MEAIITQFTKELKDNIIGISVLLPTGGQMLEGIVKSRKRTSDNLYLIQKENTNPLLDTRVYNIEFPYGGIMEYSTNTIIESLLENSDEEGNTFGIIVGIVGHWMNADALKSNQATVYINSQRKKVVTTKGWDLYVEWKDGTHSWIPLKDVKSSNPLMMAEYAV